MLYGKRLIALCTSRVYDVQVNEFIRTLNDLLVRENCMLFIFSINNDMYWEDDNVNAGTSVYRLIDYAVTDAVIIMEEKIKSHLISEKIAADARAHEVPIIRLDGDGDGICVNFDFETGFEQIVRHVIEEHHVRRPHFIAGFRDNPFSDARIRIFQKVLAENEIPFAEDMVSYGDFWAKPAAEATVRLIESGSLPEAILCANDIMALSVCATLAQKGVRVPEDVIVTGFDGYDEIYFSMPKISSVRCGNDTMARAVFDALMGIFTDHKTTGRILVLPELVLNGSCGCPDAEVLGDVFGRMNAGFHRYQDDIRLMFNVSEVVQMSDSPEKIAACMREELFEKTCCILNKSCLSRENDYFSSERVRPGQGFEEEMVLLYDQNSDSYDIRPIMRSELVPNLRALTQREYPLIFAAVTYMDKPMGYVCFSYDNCGMTDYAKTFQITAALGIGLGGYIIRQHQQYLNEKVEEMYKNDFLTKLYNRSGFYAAFESLKSNPAFVGKKVLLISSDLDGLKYINDHFGHDAGDIAIKTVAEALKGSCPEDSLCARFGGDEMIALVFGEHAPEDIIDRINRYLDDFNAGSGLDYLVTASCGYCRAIFQEGFDFDFVTKVADENMYKIKRGRK